ncbi:hypothetical protein KQJ29_36430, partial [Enterococcus sp. S181_ASV_20]|nr:hypothetical protein [Enterococcus sp. S181_ASV_20]
MCIRDRVNVSFFHIQKNAHPTNADEHFYFMVILADQHLPRTYFLKRCEASAQLKIYCGLRSDLSLIHI